MTVVKSITQLSRLQLHLQDIFLFYKKNVYFCHVSNKFFWADKCTHVTCKIQSCLKPNQRGLWSQGGLSRQVVLAQVSLYDVLLRVFEPTLRDHLSFKTAFTWQKGWSYNTGGLIRPLLSGRRVGLISQVLLYKWFMWLSECRPSLHSHSLYHIIYIYLPNIYKFIQWNLSIKATQGTRKVAVMNMWTFYTGSITHKMVVWDFDIVAFISRGLLYTGGHYSRFYFNKKLFSWLNDKAWLLV